MSDTPSPPALIRIRGFRAVTPVTLTVTDCSQFIYHYHLIIFRWDFDFEPYSLSCAVSTIWIARWSLYCSSMESRAIIPRSRPKFSRTLASWSAWKDVVKYTEIGLPKQRRSQTWDQRNSRLFSEFRPCFHLWDWGFFPTAWNLILWLGHVSDDCLLCHIIIIIIHPDQKSMEDLSTFS